MVFLKHGDITKDQMLAVGDVAGHLHVHIIPKNLVRQSGKELELMEKFLEREVKRVHYFQDRRQKLAELKEHMEKQAQMAAEKEEVDKSKADADTEKADAHHEQIYRKLEEDCIEQLKSGG